MLSSTNMLMIKAIRDRKIATLWSGQVFSAMGDEIYRVAFIWLAVDVIGSNVGYLSSLQLVANLLMSIFGSRLVDHLHSDRAMIRLDIFRASITLIPVILYALHLPSFAALALCSLALAALGALFDPALMETIPKVAQEPTLLKAANGLMSTTFRLARVMGPATVGFLSGFIPMIHFFTIDAISFLISAFSIRSLKLVSAKPKALPPFTFLAFLEDLGASIRLLRSQPVVYRAMMAKSITGGAWYLGYGVGIVILAHEIDPTSVTTFGLMMSCYGFGNILSALVLGNSHRRNPERLVYQGLTWLGITFAAIALSQPRILILVFIALSAIGGPWNDLPFTDLVQAHYPTQDLAKIFKLRNITETFFTLVMMVFSPILFRLFGARGVLLGCGVIMLFCGLIGEWHRRRYQTSRFPN